jgi:hypothetical protein
VRLDTGTSRALHGVSEGGLSSSQTCEGHTQRGAGHVIHADVVEEVDGVGITAVFSANPELHARVYVPPPLNCGTDQLADADGVDRLERVAGEETLFTKLGLSVPGQIHAFP